jgi:RNA polymerase primary sigma factor
MAIFSPIGDISETFLTTLASPEVFPITKSSVEVDMNARLPKTASKHTTIPLVEMDPLLSERHVSFLDETDELDKGSDANGLAELPIHARPTRTNSARQAPGSEDSFYSYLRDIRGLGLLSPDEEIDLAQKIADGDEVALRKLIESNLRLVITIARRYIGTGVPLIDLIQEGNLGLMRAAEKFDYRRGIHFGTYATWWIRQAVSRAAGEQSRLIHLPEHVTTNVRKVRRAADQLSQTNGLDPQPEQIAEACNLDLEEVIDLLEIVEQPVSLDTPIDDEARYTLVDMLEDTAAPTLTETASQQLLGEGLNEALTLLTPRERAVITFRYGIGDGRSRTLLEVGKELGISRERVRQLEVVGLKKMRTHLGSQILDT